MAGDLAGVSRSPKRPWPQRIVRAKRKIRDASITYRVPTEAEAAYATARSITANPVEQAFLDAQRATLSRSHSVNE